MRFKVLALLERIYTDCGDAQSAGKVISSALEQAGGRRGDLTWCVYFRSKLVTNVALEPDGKLAALRNAAHVATECTNYMGRHARYLDAAAFALARCQFLLAAPLPDYGGIEAGLKVARMSLERVEWRKSKADVLLLDALRCLFRALLLVRKGLFVDELVIKKTKEASSRAVEFGNSVNEVGSWHWATSQVIAALTCHVMAVVYRCKRGKQLARMLADNALRKVGVRVKDDGEVMVASWRDRRLSRAAWDAMMVMLLESSARHRMMSLEMGPAAAFLSAAARVTFNGYESQSLLSRAEGGEHVDLSVLFKGGVRPNQIRVKLCVLLLCAEYHNLLGRLRHAHVAEVLLRAVLSVSDLKPNDSKYVSDAWQKALSLVSLLTGEQRASAIIATVFVGNRAEGPDQSSGIDSRFGNMQILSMAWFTIGVFNMRRGDIIESRAAMQRALEATGPKLDFGEQVIVNSLAVNSGLSLNRGHIGDDVERTLKEAIAHARALDDPVTLCRALRQLKKLESRRSIGSYSARQAPTDDSLGKSCADCFADMRRKQDRAKRRIVEEPVP